MAAVAKMADPGLARASWEIGRDAADLVRDLVGRHGIDCGLKSGLLYVNHRARYDAASRLGFSRFCASPRTFESR